MSAADPAERQLIAKSGAHTRWARCEDRSAATAPARERFLERFEDEVDPDRKLDPAERARRAEHARRAYFARLALKSARARRRARELEADADAADAELAALETTEAVAQ